MTLEWYMEMRGLSQCEEGIWISQRGLDLYMRS